MNRWINAALAVPFALAACGDDPTGPEGTAQVRLAFATTAAPGTQNLQSAAPGQMSVVGTNGTLLITDIKLIVAEFELEGDDDACEEITGNDDDCMDFEAPPTLLDLPLDGGEVVVATASVPAGVYTEMEFEIEDLDEDDDSPEWRDHIGQIRADLLALYPDFPEEASMVVSGTFTPAGGTAQPFTVYFDADIEVEMDLVPALVISAEDGASRTITVNMQPAAWFAHGGLVLDLSAFDGQTLDFSLEIEQGFDLELDWDDDD